MAQVEPFYVTEKGLNKIKEELQHLTTVKREELATKLEIAIEQDEQTATDYIHTECHQLNIDITQKVEHDT